MRLRLAPVLLAALATATMPVAAAAQQVARAAAQPEFTADRFRAHVTFLADDLLEGRDAGSRGYDLAALYVATRFEALGLKPAGDGGWYQQVPFVQYRMADAPAALTIGGKRFAHGDTVILSPTPSDAPLTLEAPVVFAGYGLSAPAAGLDDYAGLDVKGKVVAVLNGTPDGLPSDVAAHLNAEKRRMAEAQGAVGMITIRGKGEAGGRPFERLARSAGEPVMTWVAKDGTPFSPAPGIRFRATLDTPAAEALFAGAPRSLSKVLAEAGKEGARPKGFALKPVVKVEQRSTIERFTSPNVLGVLPGSDPALAGEYVLLMGHLDHEGVREAKPGTAADEDRIHNGALDNATGIATMLEVARAMAESPDRPKRPILFAAVTAEEDGLLGAQYLAKNPVVGSGRVAGVVNLDMPVLLYDFKDVIAFGAEHSTMGAAVEKAGAGIGVALTPDPLPEQGLFTRSDHYRFVQEGIPSVFLMTGFANGGDKEFTGFLATHYHKVSDDLALPIDWQAGAKFARINYEIARQIADAPESPLWYRDSFFGKTVAPGAAKAARPKP